MSFRQTGYAGVLPKINGLAIESLWDTGASTSLILKSIADQLVQNGAVLKPLSSPVNMVGLGDASLPSLGRLHGELELKDGVKRSIVAHVCKDCPFRMIIGLDFMMKEELGCFPTSKGIEICTRKGRKVIERFFSFSPTIPTINASTAVESLVHQFRQCSLEAKTERLNAWLISLKSDRRQLLNDLTTCKLKLGATLQDFERVWTSTMQEFLCAEVLVVTSAKNDESPQETTQRILEGVKTDFPRQRPALLKLLTEFQDVFSAAGSDVGRASGEPVVIRVKDPNPVNIRNYRTPLKLRDVLRKILDELLKAGVIERCKSSSYNSPCLLVPKKLENGEVAGHRLVIDFRQLNKAIDTVVFPMPRIQDILCDFKGCSVFSVMDIRHAYYTIAIDATSRSLTAFSCEFGKYQFRFLPQGLSISPAVFQNRIQTDMEDIPRTNPFMDDISTATPTPQEHIDILKRIFLRLRKSGYKLKLSKCEFMRRKVTFTGMDVSARGVHISDSKKDGVRKLVPPETVGQAMTLLGFISFLRAHAPYYCDIVAPIQSLTRLGKSNTSIVDAWTPTHDKALERIKELLLNEDVLCFPDTDKPFELFTDASQLHMSAVLMQRNKSGNRQPIGYWSKGFKGSQLAWSALVKEARAVKEGTEHFGVFIKGCEVYLRCDHKPLERFLESQTKNQMANRWSLDIQEYNLKFRWVSSKDNISDCLSRTVIRPSLIQEGLYKPLKTADLHEFPERAILKKATEELKRGKVTDGIQTNTESVKITTTNKTNKPIRDSKSHTPVAEMEKLLAILPRHQAVPLEELEKLIKDNIQIVDGEALTLKRFRDMQQKDAYVKRIKKELRKNKKGKITREFLLNDGILYRHKFGIHDGKEHLDRLALVIPQELVLTVLANTHEELLHPGRDKMLAALEFRVYWKTMRRDVNEYALGCELCAIKTMKDPDYRNKPVADAVKPMQRLALDTWKSGDQLALTAMCQHSQYPFLVPIPDKSAESVIEAFLTIITEQQCPKEVLTDNGTEFVNEKFTQLCKERSITHIRTASYSPRTNSILERWHGYLNAVFRITRLVHDEASWEKCARSAVEAYRKMPHTSTGESPYFLMTGREPELDIDHLLPTITKNIWTPEGTVDKIILSRAHALARKNATQARLKHQDEINNPQPVFKIGDRVYLRKYIRTKIDPRWTKYWKVIEVMDGERSVIIQHEETGQQQKANVRNVRLRDPLVELLRNSKVDTIPGRSKLYMRADDLEDLRWPAVKSAPHISPEDLERVKEVVRDRTADKEEQVHPDKTESTQKNERPEATEGMEEDVPETEVEPEVTQPPETKRGQRARRRPRALDDYVTGHCHPRQLIQHRLMFIHSKCGN
jgi:hypothetical protein